MLLPKQLSVAGERGVQRLAKRLDTAVTSLGACLIQQVQPALKLAGQLLSALKGLAGSGTSQLGLAVRLHCPQWTASSCSGWGFCGGSGRGGLLRWIARLLGCSRYRDRCRTLCCLFISGSYRVVMLGAPSAPVAKPSHVAQSGASLWLALSLLGSFLSQPAHGHAQHCILNP